MGPVSYVWELLIVIGFVHTGLMSALLYSAVQKIPTILVAGLAFIYPVVAIAKRHYFDNSQLCFFAAYQGIGCNHF